LDEVRLAFVGFGTVGQGCARHLVRSLRILRKQFGFNYKVVTISDIMKGSVQNNRRGLDLHRALDLCSQGKKLDAGELKGETNLSPIESIRTSDANIVVETTWTNLKDGQPGLRHIETAIKSGKDVATSNKGPLALAYKKLVNLAESKGRQLRFESTVMSGTPVFNLREFCLRGATITNTRGILNGTTNYILTEMGAGKSYTEALKKAQELGYAEAEPAGDVEALDPAAKITILANALMDARLNFEEVEREGITGISIEDVTNAAKESKRIKLIATASRSEDGGVRANVRPTTIPASDMFAHINGVMNALQVTTDVQPDVTVIGPGAGGDSAGYGLVSDILAIHVHGGKRRR
jgi:homoserine dehydrogenase